MRKSYHFLCVVEENFKEKIFICYYIHDDTFVSLYLLFKTYHLSEKETKKRAQKLVHFKIVHYKNYIQIYHL
jgi:hypothetical protein